MDNTEKAKLETIKALTAASEMLMSAINNAKAGKALDPKGIGKIIDALSGVKAKYPSPKSKTMTAAEFVTYAKAEKSEIEKLEPATRVARAAQLQSQVDDAQKQIESGSETIQFTISEGEPAPTQELSPLETQGMAMSGFEDVTTSIKELTETVKGLKDSLEKSDEPEPEKIGWADDMAGDPAMSDDPKIKWGHENSDIAKRAPLDFGPDSSDN